MNETLSVLFKSGVLEKYKNSEQIVGPDQKPEYVWLVVSGLVHQYDVKPSGDTVTLNVYRPGSVLSLSWALTNLENQYFYEAAGKVELRKLSAGKYREFLKQNPDEMYELLGRLAKGFEGIFSRIAVNSHNDAHLRVLNELRLEQARFGKIELTIKELTSRTGLARETVSRVMAKLETESIIARDKKITTLSSPDNG